jgi:hypothetical protein
MIGPSKAAACSGSSSVFHGTGLCGWASKLMLPYYDPRELCWQTKFSHSRGILMLKVIAPQTLTQVASTFAKRDAENSCQLLEKLVHKTAVKKAYSPQDAWRALQR